MKHLLVYSLSLGLAAAGALRSVPYGSLGKRSHELHVSLEAEAYMSDVSPSSSPVQDHY